MEKEKSFDCPNCGNALKYSGGSEDIIRCGKCGSSVTAPDILSVPDSFSPGEEPESPQFSGNPKELAKLAELGVLVADGRKIEAVKKYREIFGVSLKESKEAVEKMLRGEGATVTYTSTTTTTNHSFSGDEVNNLTEIKELAELVKANKKIEAIKLYRELYGSGLKEAKEAVEKMMRGESVTVSRTTTFESSQPTTTWEFPSTGTAKYSEFKQFAELVKDHRNKDAAKLYSGMYEVPLHEAYDAVYKLEKDISATSLSPNFSRLTSFFFIAFLSLLAIILLYYFFPANPITDFIDKFIPQ